jgi:negative regulator of flagellin synthesis FlgM
MDIKNIAGGLNTRTIDNQSQTTKNNSPQGPSSTKNVADQVTISSSVKDLEQQAKTSSVDNSVRIEELKQAIKDGNYQVDAEKVATKLIETELLIAGS